MKPIIKTFNKYRKLNNFCTFEKKKKMKKSILTIISALILSTQIIYSQFNVEWSNLQKKSGSLSEILPLGGSDFFTTRYQGRGIFTSPYLYNHSNFELTFKGKVSSQVENGMGSIYGVYVINNSPVVFLSDKTEGKNILYLQKYNGECKPVGSSMEVAQYTMPKGWKRKGYFNVIQSQNGDFFCVIYEIPGSKYESERFGYKVFKNSFEIISEGEYEAPFDQNISELSNHYLSNTGDYFVTCKVYQTNAKGRIRDRSLLEKVILFHITPDEMEELELQTGTKRVTDISISSDNQRNVTVTGLYGEGNVGTKGIFFMMIDFDKKQITSEGFEPFKKDFITEGWSDRAKAKAEKKESKGKGTPALYNYDIRDIITLKDGSFIGLMEQFYIRVVTQTDSRGFTTTTYYYYYNTIIAYKVDKDGKFSWVKKIPKYQVSTNDGGYLSSFGHFYNEDNVVIMFNDNLKNYDENGKWNNNTLGSSFRKKTNCVSQTVINIKSGEIERKSMFARAETGAIAVPKLFKTNYNNNEMLVYLIMGKKEKFGLITF
jgi:hypothetical protein